MDNNYYYAPPGAQNNNNSYAGVDMYYYQLKAKQERKEIRKAGNIMGLCVLAYVFVQLAASFILTSNSAIYDKYLSSSIFQNSYGIIFVEFFAVLLPFGIMALINRKKYTTPIIPSKPIKFSQLCLWVGFGMLCCVGADYIVGIMTALAETFGYELTQGETLDPDSPFACLIAVIATAVVPAVCEELAMRCCALGYIQKYGKAFGVVAVSIVFGLLHGNLIQFVFATIVGLILGYVTMKTGSIIPAVLIHGFNNGMSAMSTVFVYMYGEDASNITTYVFFGLWFVLGLISLVILTIKKQLNLSFGDESHEPFANKTSKKLGAFLTSPVLIISSLYLIVSVIASITKM